MQLAGVVREAMLGTTTYRLTEGTDGQVHVAAKACVSACFLVWVAGTERRSSTGTSREDGRFGIGLHRPFFPKGAYNAKPAKIAEAQQAMTTAVREYLRREQVPEEYVAAMLDRSSREIYWLNEGEDSNALDGRAAWFEEMMISQCAFDPVYDREAIAAGARIIDAGRSVMDDPGFQTHAAWRRKYNTCEYRTRIEAQSAMRQ
jgi:hypothetical protein